MSDVNLKMAGYNRPLSLLIAFYGKMNLITLYLDLIQLETKITGQFREITLIVFCLKIEY